MEFTPERIEQFFAVRVLDPIRKKWYTTRWKMTREDAAKHYADTEYEIREETMEERKVGGNPYKMMGSHFMKQD
ncbi:MAG TPA: hypothetical protein VJ577_08555 [Burkholderiaceae bacterium]|nr:hypothetical protein [Burkholderiaceae bacterium]